MDYLNLKIIEQEVKQGNEICVLRLFDKQGGKAKRIILTNENGTSKREIKGVSDSLREIAKDIYDEMINVRKLADVKDYSIHMNSPLKLAAEILRPKLRLVVFGAGHVGQGVGLVGSLLGFDVIVVDDRLEFASRKRFPDPSITLLVGDYSTATETLKLGTNSAVVIVTRGHQFDESCLRATIGSKPGYLGMIGSKRRVFSIFNRLEKDGYSREDLEKVHAPIGLRIGAKSPQEIAVAIVAEIVSYFNGGGLK